MMSRAVKVALALAALPLLLAAVWVFLYVLGGARLSRALDDLREEGYATSLEELAPARPEPNAATAYAAAFALEPPDGPEEEAVDEAEKLGLASLSPERKAAVEAYLAGAAEYFAALRRARAAGTCRFGWNYGQGYYMDMGELTKTTPAARLLLLRAQAEAAAGRDAEARECVRDILALADVFREEPTQIGQLVRYTLLSRAVDAAHRCVGPSTDAKPWLDVLPDPKILDGSADLGLRGELAMAAMIMKGAPGAFESPGVLAPWWKLNAAKYLGTLKGLIELARQPYTPARAAALQSETDLARADGGILNLWILMLPATARVLELETSTRAALALARTGLAAEVERAEKGRYPEAVEAIDPLSGKPFVREADRLESVGVPNSFKTLEEARHVWIFRR